MSIILDALKKSEAQRRLGQTPTLGSAVKLPESTGQHRRFTSASWIVTLGVVFAVAAWFVYDWTSTPAQELATASPAPKSAAEQSTPTEPERITSQDQSAKTPVQNYVPLVSIPVGEAQKPVQKPVPAAASPKQESAAEQSPLHASITPLMLFQLPKTVREEIPDIHITMQVYSEQIEQRFALVNGRRLKQGDTLATGLELVEIRRKGLVFSYRNYRFVTGE